MQLQLQLAMQDTTKLQARQAVEVVLCCLVTLRPVKLWREGPYQASAWQDSCSLKQSQIPKQIELV